jgi:hypothetical protein
MQFDKEKFFAEARDFAAGKKKKRGQLATMAMAFVGLIAAGFIILVYMYTGSTLATSLNNTNVTLVWNNITASIVNFSAQLGTVGTIAGVMLLLALIGGAGYLIYSKIGGGKGGSGM